MRIPPYLVNLLSRALKPEIDPRRARRVYREFDLNRGYREYHELCKARFARGSAPACPEDLRVRGFDYLDVLEPGYAHELLREINSRHALSYVKKDTKNLQGFHVTDEKLIREVLHAVLKDEVDRHLVGFFESEYLIHWLTFTMAPQAEEQDSVSFRWHCDKGPRSHLKLIVYLNASEEHGGNTEFIDLDDTASVASRGYVFAWSLARSGDVDHLSRIAGREIRPHLKPMRAGEGVLFQPASVLHRGYSPRRGPRYVLTLCLLPSPLHWEAALERGAISDLASDAKWHRHASELSSMLEHRHCA